MAPAVVGKDERRLRRSSTLAGVGDGVVAVALPLIAANITRDPLAVAGVLAAQHLPWVAVGLGWPYLRGDRRTLLGSIDTIRAVVLGLIGLLVLAGQETILGIQLAAFVVGLGEALTDGTETETGDVSGLSTRGMLGLAVVGLPLGGVLYEVFPATPFLFDMLAFAAAALFALLVRREVPPSVAPRVPADESSPAPPRPSVPVMVAAGLAALAGSAVLGVLVLFALDDLGLGAPAFGVLLAGMAVSAAAGGFVAPEVGTAIGVRAGAVVALVVAGTAHATTSQVADPSRPWAAALALGVAAACGMVASVLVRAELHVRAGRPLLGPPLQRVHLAVWVAIPIGALAGGWLGRHRGIAEVFLWSAGAWAAAAVALLAAGRGKSFDGPDQGVIRSPQPHEPVGEHAEEV